MAKRLILIVLIGVVLVSLTVALRNLLTSRFPGANDFGQRWFGARAFWVEGKNPYSPEVSLGAELFLYGAPYSRDIALDQYPGDFLYPFHTAIVLAPLAVLSYDWASAAWMVIQGALIVASFLALASMYGWRLSPVLVGIGILWVLTLYVSVRGIFLGQPGVTVVCLQLLTLWALSKNHNAAAGIMLAVSTFKPQLGFLLYPLLLVWALRYRRYRFVVSFVVAGSVLLAGSFVLAPTWLIDWLNQTIGYTGYTAIGSPVWVVMQYYLRLGNPGEIGLSAALIAVTLWAWWRVIVKRDMTWFDWTVALTLTVTHLTALRTATPHFVAYLPVLVFTLREVARSNRRAGDLLVIGAMVALNAALWAVFLATRDGRLEGALNYLPLPFGCLVLLWLLRHRWWESRSTVGEGRTALAPVQFGGA